MQRSEAFPCREQRLQQRDDPGMGSGSAQPSTEEKGNFRFPWQRSGGWKQRLVPAWERPRCLSWRMLPGRDAPRDGAAPARSLLSPEQIFGEGNRHFLQPGGSKAGNHHHHLTATHWEGSAGATKGPHKIPVSL